MAKEEDLKRVDLKVTVNCCDGCKRKVLKALSIKGVLKTEIHPTLPKITVTGNVDVLTLIKKLSKIGKSAELWPSASAATNPEKEIKPEKTMAKEPDNINNEKQRAKETKAYDQEKNEKSKSNTGNVSNSTDSKKNKEAKIKENEEGNIIRSDKIKENAPEDTKGPNPDTVTNIPQMSCLTNPNIMPPHLQGYYPPMQLNHQVQVPYYAMNMNAYAASPICHCQLPLYRPPLPATGFADYFNDENTVGCHVM